MSKSYASSGLRIRIHSYLVVLACGLALFACAPSPHDAQQGRRVSLADSRLHSLRAVDETDPNAPVAAPSEAADTSPDVLDAGTASPSGSAADGGDSMSSDPMMSGA